MPSINRTKKIYTRLINFMKFGTLDRYNTYYALYGHTNTYMVQCKINKKRTHKPFVVAHSTYLHIYRTRSITMVVIFQ